MGGLIVHVGPVVRKRCVVEQVLGIPHRKSRVGVGYQEPVQRVADGGVVAHNQPVIAGCSSLAAVIKHQTAPHGAAGAAPRGREGRVVQRQRGIGSQGNSITRHRALVAAPHQRFAGYPVDVEGGIAQRVATVGEEQVAQHPVAAAVGARGQGSRGTGTAQQVAGRDASGAAPAALRGRDGF